MCALGQVWQCKLARAGNEDRAEGALGGKVVWAYIAAAGGVAWLVGLVIAYVCEQGAKTFTDYWLILWTEQTFGNRGHLFYIGMYALIAVGFSAITYARSLFFAFGTVRFPPPPFPPGRRARRALRGHT